MGRGLERRRILSTDTDKQDFIIRLGNGLSETGTQCLAWAIMDNHYHLLLRVGITPLSDLMRKLVGGYATHYNRRHGRVGYVFQNRYKSILCDEELYLLELVRYIHLNPVRAKIINSLPTLDSYPWTGHAVLLGNLQQDWQHTKDVLARFHQRLTTARNLYRQFITQGLNTATEVDFNGGGLIRSYGGWQSLEWARKEHEQKIGDERILGDSDFVQQALTQDSLRIEARSQLIREGWDLEMLIHSVCAYFQVEPADVTQKGRRNGLSFAKSVICYLGSKELYLSSTVISARLNIGQSAVSMSSKRGRFICDKNELNFKRLAQYRVK
ncbi:transposase [Vibrio sp.]|uniref:transposase n=1 Tax=Vibrio sp. TaxID=678 RepID=UPI003D09CF88